MGPDSWQICVDTTQVYFRMTFSGRGLPILGAFDVVGPLINILQLFLGDLNCPDMQSETNLNLIIQGQRHLEVFYPTSHYLEEDIKNV